MTPIAATIKGTGERCWIVAFQQPDPGFETTAVCVFDNGRVQAVNISNLQVDVELFERTYAAAQK